MNNENEQDNQIVIKPPLFDREARIIATIMQILDPMSAYDIKRILTYLIDRYGHE